MKSTSPRRRRVTVAPMLLLQVEFADALAHDLLAGNENAAEIELRAVQLDVGLKGLTEDLFGAHQTVVIADCHHDVAPLQPGVATHDVTRFPVLDAADHEARVAVRAQDFLDRAADHGGIHHREIPRADLRAIRRQAPSPASTGGAARRTRTRTPMTPIG